MFYYMDMEYDNSRNIEMFPYAYAPYTCGNRMMRRKESRAQFRFPNDGHWRG